MSVEAPSAPSSREQHDAARRKVLGESVQKIEQVSQVKNADFAKQVDKLQQSYQGRGDIWPTDPAYNSDEGVYVRILQRTQAGDGMLPGYENVVLSYMDQQSMLRDAEAAVDPTALGDNKEATIRALIAEAEALPDDDQTKSGKLLSLNNVLVRMQPGAHQSRGDELSTYVTNAEVHERTPVQDQENRALTGRFLENSREDLVNVLESNEDDIRVYQLMAAKHPAPARPDAPTTLTGETASQDQTAEQQQAPAEKSKELLAAEEKLSGLRKQLAEINARREKRLTALTPKSTEEEVYSTKLKQLKAAYETASRDVFMLQNPDLRDNPNIAHVDKVKMIADYTVDEAGKLDEQILESYKNNKTKFGKFLDWYGKRGVPAKLVIGVVGGMAIGFATGGVGTAAWSSALMATSFEARNRAKREAGANMLTLKGKGGLLDTLDQQLDGEGGRATLSTIDLDAAHSLLHSTADDQSESRIKGERRHRAKRLFGSIALGTSIGLVANNLPGGYFDGLNGSHDHVASAVSGHEGAVATPDASHIAAAPSPDGLHNVYTGPANVYVNPGDGFYKVFEQMHIPQDQWNTVLDKIGPNLVHHGDAYVMPDGGIGISAPGQMSQAAVDLIKNAANFR